MPVFLCMLKNVICMSLFVSLFLLVLKSHHQLCPLGQMAVWLSPKAGQQTSCSYVQYLSASRQHGTDGDEIPFCCKGTAYSFILASCQPKEHEGQQENESGGTYSISILKSQNKFLLSTVTQLRSDNCTFNEDKYSTDIVSLVALKVIHNSHIIRWLR